MVNLSLHDVTDVVGAWVTACRHAQNVQRIANGGEGVAQLVGEDRQKLVLAAVRFTQRRFGFLALCDVPRDFRCTNDVAAGISNRRHCQGDVDSPAVLGDPDGLEMLDALTLA